MSNSLTKTYRNIKDYKITEKHISVPLTSDKFCHFDDEKYKNIINNNNMFSSIPMSLGIDIQIIINSLDFHPTESIELLEIMSQNVDKKIDDNIILKLHSCSIDDEGDHFFKESNKCVKIIGIHKKDFYKIFKNCIIVNYSTTEPHSFIMYRTDIFHKLKPKIVTTNNEDNSYNYFFNKIYDNISSVFSTGRLTNNNDYHVNGQHNVTLNTFLNKKKFIIDPKNIFIETPPVFTFGGTGLTSDYPERKHCIHNILPNGDIVETKNYVFGKIPFGVYLVFSDKKYFWIERRE